MKIKYLEMKKFGSFIFFICFFVLPFSGAAFTPNDTLFERQGSLKQIRAPQAWDLARGSSDVIVAVVDTGIDITHPDMDEAIWTNPDEIPDNGLDDDNNGYIDDIHGWNYINNNNDITPNFSKTYSEDGIHHGTSIASIIGAEGNNKLGIVGVAFGVKIMPLKVLDELGNGDTKKAAQAVYYALDKGADVVNLSFVGFVPEDELDTAIQRAWEQGVVVVAAAGNTTPEAGGLNLNEYDEYPACYDQADDEEYVLGAAATDPLDQKGKFSNYGSMCVDVSAPGMNILSARVYNPDAAGYDKFYNDDWSGTSFAAPFVSGLAALIKSANPGLGAREINEIIMQTGDNIDALNQDYAGALGKRINAEKAVELALSIARNGSSFPQASPRGFAANFYKMAASGVSEESFLAFDNFYHGFNVEMGEINNDGVSEIVAGAGYGGGPQVRIFSQDGRLLGQFFAYDKYFRGGVDIALGDVNADGKKEIITAAGRGGGPHILIWDDHAKIRGNFMAHDKSFHGEISVAAGEVNDDGDDEIIVGFFENGKINIKIFKRDGSLINHFYFDALPDSKVEVRAVDLNNDLREEIIIVYKTGEDFVIKAYTMQGGHTAEFSEKIDSELFDIKSYFDYFEAGNRLVISFTQDDKLVLKYFDQELNFIKDAELNL